MANSGRGNKKNTFSFHPVVLCVSIGSNYVRKINLFCFFETDLWAGIQDKPLEVSNSLV